MKRKGAPPGDLVYLSERKLFNLAVHFGLKTDRLKPESEIEGSAGVSVGLPVAKISAKGRTRTERTDPAADERKLAQLLDQTVKRLGGKKLPSLDDAEEIREAEWFRFHRPLRFGVGAEDGSESIQALVVVDETRVPEGLSLPGLLMHGSVAHVLPPYASEELRNAPGKRSGSGTGHLFAWLDRARRALEADPDADLAAVDTSPFASRASARDARAARDMYGLFSEERWMDLGVVPPLLHGAPCAGVAQATFIAESDELTLVMGSPLYVRVRALPGPTGRR